jgi:hypothetical protein
MNFLVYFGFYKYIKVKIHKILIFIKILLKKKKIRGYNNKEFKFEIINNIIYRIFFYNFY